MHTELLQELGLSPNEAKIYEALITYGGSGVSTISLRSKVHRRNAYDSLHRLIEKGLVYEVFGEGETVYEAVEPTKLMEFVKEQEERLSAALPDLLSSFTEHKAQQSAYIYRGVEGVKNYLRSMLKAGEDVYSFAAKGAWFDPRLETYLKWFIKEMEKKGVAYYHIFDHEVEKEFPEVPYTVGKPFKYLPKEYSTNSTMDIFGDYVVTFNGLQLGKLDDDITIFVMVSPGLAESYRTWWKLIWDLLPEPKETSK